MVLQIGYFLNCKIEKNHIFSFDFVENYVSNISLQFYEIHSIKLQMK